jgi:hypothetical protein
MLSPHLNERQQRALATDAVPLGRDGGRAVERATEVSETTVGKRVFELRAAGPTAPLSDTPRRQLVQEAEEHDLLLVPALLAMVKPDERAPDVATAVPVTIVQLAIDTQTDTTRSQTRRRCFESPGSCPRSPSPAACADVCTLPSRTGSLTGPGPVPAGLHRDRAGAQYMGDIRYLPLTGGSSSISPPCWTASAAGPSAGPSPTTRAPVWSPTRCGWQTRPSAVWTALCSTPTTVPIRLPGLRRPLRPVRTGPVGAGSAPARATGPARASTRLGNARLSKESATSVTSAPSAGPSSPQATLLRRTGTSVESLWISSEGSAAQRALTVERGPVWLLHRTAGHRRHCEASSGMIRQTYG